MKLGKDNKRKRHANEFMRTSFSNSGRIAGMGILHDSYDEEAYPSVCLSPSYCPARKVDFPISASEKEFRENGGKVISYNLKDRRV